MIVGCGLLNPRDPPVPGSAAGLSGSGDTAWAYGAPWMAMGVVGSGEIVSVSRSSIRGFEIPTRWTFLRGISIPLLLMRTSRSLVSFPLADSGDSGISRGSVGRPRGGGTVDVDRPGMLVLYPPSESRVGWQSSCLREKEDGPCPLNLNIFFRGDVAKSVVFPPPIFPHFDGHLTGHLHYGQSTTPVRDHGPFDVLSYHRIIVPLYHCTIIPSYPSYHFPIHTILLSCHQNPLGTQLYPSRPLVLRRTAVPAFQLPSFPASLPQLPPYPPYTFTTLHFTTLPLYHFTTFTTLPQFHGLWDRSCSPPPYPSYFYDHDSLLPFSFSPLPPRAIHSPFPRNRLGSFLFLLRLPFILPHHEPPLKGLGCSTTSSVVTLPKLPSRLSERIRSSPPVAINQSSIEQRAKDTRSTRDKAETNATSIQRRRISLLPSPSPSHPAPRSLLVTTRPPPPPCCYSRTN
ncbi:hypothetical protein N7462_006970 [Penicillium macrosclerotiorum]|uniref:uncharacterized protein n=1 Tax=Penicillium macrosclerotiorum TaxID=303699 RepID=UPI0025470669|nr:uncharacterized protein N7462_006970 [Penicillium macrosclerotiorum]KAJ5678726.1 hypothetical protein N7462_006970 [Penicillium macrosclerotiorum]